jgi:hypothetical protein
MTSKLISECLGKWRLRHLKEKDKMVRKKDGVTMRALSTTQEFTDSVYFKVDRRSRYFLAGHQGKVILCWGAIRPRTQVVDIGPAQNRISGRSERQSSPGRPKRRKLVCVMPSLVIKFSESATMALNSPHTSPDTVRCPMRSCITWFYGLPSSPRDAVGHATACIWLRG